MSGNAASRFSIEIDHGNYLDLWKPDAELITIRGLATALGKACRYAGWCDGFFSVAEHAVLVATRLEDEGHDWHTCLLGLHHDSQEAFTGNVTRPYKRLIREITGTDALKLIEERIQTQVLHALGIEPGASEQWAAVKAMDDWACSFEAFHLLESKGEGWAPCDPDALTAPEVGISRLWGWDWVEAARQFERHHKYLMPLAQAAA